MADESLKHKVISRLEDRNAERSLANERRQETRIAESNPDESPEKFWDEVREIENELNTALSATPPSFDHSHTLLQNLRLAIARSAYFLPPYDVRQSQELLQQLEARVGRVREEAAPKQKFSFRSRNKKREEKVKSLSASEADGLSSAESTTSVGSTSASSEIITTSTSQEQPPVLDVIKGVVNGQRGVRIVMDAYVIGSDVTLTNLEECTIWLQKPLSSLLIRNLKKCIVVSAPVAGGVHIENSEECVYAIIGHQIRLHTSTDTDFYVHSRSGPIIEHCERVRFAPNYCPYVETEAQREKDMEWAKIPISKNPWNEIRDFRWLKKQQSPHWSEVPVDERWSAEVWREKRPDTS